jgi:hypothetical protein
MTIAPVYKLSARWDPKTPLILVDLNLIMNNVTCEDRLLCSPYEAQMIRNDYEPGAFRNYTSWEHILFDLDRNGIRYPVMWDPNALQLGNGHHRVVAAHDLGWTHIPVVYWDCSENWDVMASGAWYPSGGD